MAIEMVITLFMNNPVFIGVAILIIIMIGILDKFLYIKRLLKRRGDN